MRDAFKGFAVFVRLFHPHRGWMLAGSLFGLATITCGIGLLALSGWFISATASAGLTTATAHLFNFFFPSIGVRLFAVGRTASRYAERIITHDATFRILESLRLWFYRRLEPLAPAGLVKFRSGDILNRIVADIDALDNFYLRVLSPSVTALAAAILVGGFLAIFDPLICLSTLILLLSAGVVVPVAAAKAGDRVGKALARRKADLRIQVVDGLQGVAELLVFGAQLGHQERLLDMHRSLVCLQLRMSHIRGVSGALVTALSGSAVLVALYLGVERVADGRMAGANLALVGLAVLASFEAVMSLPAAFQYLGQTREAGRRLLEIVDTPLPVSFPQRSTVIPEKLDLRLDGVNFHYDDHGPAVLKNLNLKIPYGQRLAVLGQTGAGKSTLIHLLTRFRDPSSGHIFIGGQDIRTLAEQDLRHLMSVVSQGAHIFTATIRDNLLVARPDAGEEMLRKALDSARMLDFVDGLPDGIDTWVGEAGKLLSGGQARRLTVARAILKDAPLWILDEPTEGLDRDTERSLLEAILAQTIGRTLLLITHRPALLEEMDRIVILEGGQGTVCGFREFLQTAHPRYAAWLALKNRCGISNVSQNATDGVETC